AGYPITPASDILHELARLKAFGVRTFQAEDEIAAMAAVVGAAFAGELAATATSGPGLCLKAEAIGLGVMAELPMLVIDVQRGGPSTGLPTKTEQSDLFMALFGRHGDCPVPVLAAASPADCFEMVQEGMRIAVEFMVPVILLTDGYIGNGAEPWRIPDRSELKPLTVKHPTEPNSDDGFLPYKRDARLVRPWVKLGTPGLEHRIGGLEKSDILGTVDYSPENHHHMTMVRTQKVQNVVETIPDQQVLGPDSGSLLVLSWGGTYGSVREAVERCQRAGKSVAHAHLRYLNPFPKNLGEVLKRYDKVLIPELNTGQLRYVIRATYLIDPYGLNKIQGKPFRVHEIVEKINAVLED
ncbi:MAG TPA: 2-oxoglutarate ferredoxin oxidoreductase subunit alpha, partial [Planctomycetaceae bacterium]|nr:2-oxoglutarate ferredoxin oxidoreductase subunit alpha [Planctomycetaceae bacterium]